MKLQDNHNFYGIKLYKTIPLDIILKSVKTKHLNYSRQRRLYFALSLLNTNDYTEHTFLIDKHHPDGNELHNVTHSGIIFILNQRKFKSNLPCFITVLIARPNQITRLYDIFDIQISNYTLQKCLFYEKMGYNHK